jgi:hypothetical protein
VVGNVIWLVFAGCWLALLHLASAPLLAITIIGLPLAVANVKLVPAALWPFGREIVRSADVSAALAAYRARQAGPRPSTSSSGRSLRRSSCRRLPRSSRGWRRESDGDVGRKAGAFGAIAARARRAEHGTHLDRRGLQMTCRKSLRHLAA